MLGWKAGDAWVPGTTAAGFVAGTVIRDRLPPSDWLQDPWGGTWYPRSDPFVQSGWGRGAPIDTIRPADDVLPNWPPAGGGTVVPGGVVAPPLVQSPGAAPAGGLAGLPWWVIPAGVVAAFLFWPRGGR